MAGSAAALAARCKNLRRGSFNTVPKRCRASARGRTIVNCKAGTPADSTSAAYCIVPGFRHAPVAALEQKLHRLPECLQATRCLPLARNRHAEAVATCPLLRSKQKNQIGFPRTILQQIPDSLGVTLQRVCRFEAQTPAIRNKSLAAGFCVTGAAKTRWKTSADNEWRLGR
jgi:hypothetical protein